jgi:hypothetical protein
MPANIIGSNLQTLYAPPPGVDPRTLNQTQFASNFKDPYSISYTIGLQRRIGNNMGFEIRYVGTQGVSQFATQDGNPYVAGYVKDNININPLEDSAAESFLEEAAVPCGPSWHLPARR